MPELDMRLTPARDDVAAAHLRDIVRASRYVEGRVREVRVGVAALRAKPESVSRLETQLFFGERFTVYEEKDGWAWGQCSFDDYVGYVDAAALVSPVAVATHRVSTMFSQIYAAGDVKSAALHHLPMNAKLAIVEGGGKFAEVSGGGFVPRSHISSLSEAAPSFVAVAEQFLGAPYLWGGRSPDGIDCSGLVQSALERCGVNAPRDSDMQEGVLGIEVIGSVSAPLRRSDLVFWSDHVGILCDARTLLHANSHRMMVAKEMLSDVMARSEAAGRRVTSVRRLTPQ